MHIHKIQFNFRNTTIAFSIQTLQAVAPNLLGERTVREFLKTAAAVGAVPWYLFRAQQYLENLCKQNASGQPNVSDLRLEFIFQHKIKQVQSQPGSHEGVMVENYAKRPRHVSLTVKTPAAKRRRRTEAPHVEPHEVHDDEAEPHEEHADEAAASSGGDEAGASEEDAAPAILHRPAAAPAEVAAPAILRRPAAAPADVAAPAVLHRPAAKDRRFGCTKCRYGKFGCGNCRGWAAAGKHGMRLGPEGEVLRTE